MTVCEIVFGSNEQQICNMHVCASSYQVNHQYNIGIVVQKVMNTLYFKKLYKNSLPQHPFSMILGFAVFLMKLLYEHLPIRILQMLQSVHIRLYAVPVFHNHVIALELLTVRNDSSILASEPVNWYYLLGIIRL